MAARRICVVIAFALLMATSGLSAQTTDVSSDATTYIYTGQMMIPDNTSSIDPAAPWLTNSSIESGTLRIGSGWHDIEFRFPQSESSNVGTMNLFVPLTPTVANTSAATGETQVPEPNLIGLAGFAALGITRRARRC